MKADNGHLESSNHGWSRPDSAFFWRARSPNVNEHGDINEPFVRLGRVRLSFEIRTLCSFGFVNSGESELMFRLSSLYLNRRTFFPVLFVSHALTKSGRCNTVGGCWLFLYQGRAIIMIQSHKNEHPCVFIEFTRAQYVVSTLQVRCAFELRFWCAGIWYAQLPES